MQRFYFTHVLLFQNWTGFLFNPQGKARFIIADFSKLEKEEDPPCLFYTSLQIQHCWLLQWFQDFHPSFCISNKGESTQHHFLPHLLQLRDQPEQRKFWAVLDCVLKLLCMSGPPWVNHQQLAAGWGTEYQGPATPVMLQSRIMQGSQETLCGLQVTALGMWKNYDKNSRPDSFTHTVLPLRAESCRLMLQDVAGCTDFWAGHAHIPAVPQITGFFLPTPSFIPPQLCRHFPRLWLAGNIFLFLAALRKLLCHPLYLNKQTVQPSFSSFHVVCTAKPSSFFFSSSPRG